MVTYSRSRGHPAHHQWPPRILHRHGRSLVLIPAALFFVASLSSLASAQDDQSEPESELEETASSETSEVRPIEQIDVIGERSLVTMRNLIIREEESMYRMFNDLNSVDKFDITCKKETRTGSYIPIRSCEPAFFGDFRRQTNRNAIAEMRMAFGDDGIDTAILQNGLDRLQPDSELRGELEGEYEAMQEEMFRLAMEHPEYLAALQRIAALKQQYQAAREARFGND